MTSSEKKELLQEMTESKEIRKFKRTPNWEKVFQGYKEDYGVQLVFSCHSCYKTAVNYLKS